MSRTRAMQVAFGAVIAGAISLAGVAGSGDRAAAESRTTSDAIAGDAGRATEALDDYTATLNPADYVRFVQYRDQTASMTEQDTGLADGSLRDSWAGVSLDKQQILLSAVSQLGVPYRSLASDPGVGFDCSGLTIWAFGEAGVEIPRVSGDQINAAERVDRDSVEAGDLVYYPGHISIYLGVDMMVHSPNSGSSVEIGPVSDKANRFGDASAAHEDEVATTDSLVDRALAISE